MVQNISDSTVLHNGTQMPWLGLGVWRMRDGQMVEDMIKVAIQTGYRSIDTAAAYENETGVGKAIKNCGVAREELFITTKLRNEDQGYESALAAFEESRKKLDVDVIDLYLIHWPVKDKYVTSWKALEKLYSEGKVRAIGVSNFHPHHLEGIMGNCSTKPMVNQVEYHPLLIQKELQAYCRANQIVMEAYSPLMQGNLDHPSLQSIAEQHGKSVAQVVLRWDLQNEVVTIPKSATPSRIQENAEIFDFELTVDEMMQINRMNCNHRYFPDPDNFDS